MFKTAVFKMHVQKLILCLVSFCLFLTVGNSADVLNECLDSDHHKTVPGPEADLFDKVKQKV